MRKYAFYIFAILRALIGLIRLIKNFIEKTDPVKLNPFGALISCKVSKKSLEPFFKKWKNVPKLALIGLISLIKNIYQKRATSHSSPYGCLTS